MVMELDEDLDIRETAPGEHETVIVLRDPDTGEFLKLNLAQVNRILGGDMNEVPGTDLNTDILRRGREVLAAPALRNE